MSNLRRSRLLLYFAFVLGIFLSVWVKTSAQPNANQGTGISLWKHLFVDNDYNRNVRPVKEWSRQVLVNVSLAITSIIEFDEVGETITLTGKTYMTWIDDYLTWNSVDFQGVNHIHVPQSQVWKPYIAVENSVNKQSDMGTESLQVLVWNNGKVEWSPVEVFQFTCAVDVAKFPFDTQECVLVFEAFGYTGDELLIRSFDDHIDFHGFTGTSGWTVLSTSVETVDEDSELHVACTIVLSRKPLYFILNIILPITLLSFLNGCVFIMPVQSGEKASFVVTVFLSLAVFLTIVSGKLPENSDRVSVFNVYVFANVVFSTFIAVVTLLEIRIHNRDPNIPIRPFYRKIAIRFTCGLSNQAISDIHQNGSRKLAPKLSCVNNIEPRDMSPEIHLDVMDRRDSNGRQEKQTNHIPNLQAFQRITWPVVVKAADKLLFLLVLATNVCMTLVFLYFVL